MVLPGIILCEKAQRRPKRRRLGAASFLGFASSNQHTHTDRRKMAPAKAESNPPAKRGRGRPKGSVKKPHHASKAGKALAAAAKKAAKKDE